MNYLLGVDLGTSGTKTVLFDTHGSAVASETVEYPLYQPRNGWAEQDADDWWNAAQVTIRSVLQKSGVNPADVKGLAVSGQMHGLVLTDEEGKPLRKSIIWCDGRTQVECDELTAAVGAQRQIQIPQGDVTVQTQGMAPQRRQRQPHIGCKGGLACAALAGDDCYDFTQFYTSLHHLKRKK